MQTHNNFLLIVSLSCMSMSLFAMDGDEDKPNQVIRKSQSYESALAPTEPEGSYTTSIRSHAFKAHFPDEVQLVSTYATQEVVQDEIINTLMNIPWTKETTVTKEGETQSSVTKHYLDIGPLEEIMKREILEKEGPKKMADGRKQEQAKLSIIQRNPKKSLLLALCVGASLPFVLPELYKQYNL